MPIGLIVHPLAGEQVCLPAQGIDIEVGGCFLPQLTLGFAMWRAE